jgi:hypothetical protein
MIHRVPILLTCLVLVSALVDCNLPRTSPTQEVDTVASLVAATLLSMASPVPSPTPTAPVTVEVATILPTEAPTPTAGISPTPRPGSIEGSILGYPYGSIPALTVVAFDKSSPYRKYWYWKTASGNTTYAMDGYVSPGTYQVVAYDAGGHAGSCTTLVVVVSDQKVECDITDWAGSYPASPVH